MSPISLPLLVPFFLLSCITNYSSYFRSFFFINPSPITLPISSSCFILCRLHQPFHILFQFLCFTVIYASPITLPISSSCFIFRHLHRSFHIIFQFLFLIVIYASPITLPTSVPAFCHYGGPSKSVNHNTIKL